MMTKGAVFRKKKVRGFRLPRISSLPPIKDI